MRIFKRDPKGNYYLDFKPSARHKRFVRSLETSDFKLAKEVAKKIIRDSFDENLLGKRPTYLFSHVVKDWMSKHAHDRKSIIDIKQRISWLVEKFGTYPIPIRPQYLDHELSNLKVTPSTRNRYVAEMSKLMHHAHRMEWIDAVPGYTRCNEPKGRMRWLTREQAKKLAMDLPDWLQRMFWFALATGMRESNIRGLEWSRVDLKNKLVYVHADEFKGGRTVGFPMNDEAMAILKERVDKEKVYVFGREGEIPGRCSRPEWYEALKKNGLVGFRWHDLRHSWASWHAQAGTPLPVLQSLGGWATPGIVSRYSHLAPSYTATWANNSQRKENEL